MKYGFFQVFQCEVCPERFAYQEMLKFHLQQKHDKQVGNSQHILQNLTSKIF